MPSAVSTVQEAPARAGATTFVPTINDLSIRVGTVNGSGSQSANLVLLRSFYGMGIPCSGKNVFPSNIEGLPTWFHIRASAKGYVGHVLDPQILVCMNQATAKDDLLQLKPGAICIARDDFDVDLADLCDDIRLFLVPFQKLVEKAYPPDKKDKSYRDKIRKVVNMVYVGVLASVCKIEMPAVEAAIRLEFPGRKAKAAEINIVAARTGYEWAQENLPADLPFEVRRFDHAPEKILIEGNKAAALGATFGGVSVLTWYPITPSSSLAEYAEDFLKKHRVNADGTRTFTIVQAEDELAAIGMAVGAGWAGARALTATSGPGISLMSEFVGLAYFAEIPVVIVDVQRMGPSTGLPTRTSQGDILKLYFLGHGDSRHIVLIPGSVEECYSLTIEALDLAQQFQTPVFVATDLDLSMNLWLSDPFPYPAQPIQRGKVLDAAELERRGHFERYKDLDGDGVCYRTIPGTEHPLSAYFTRGTGHNEKSGYSERPEDWKKNLDRLARKLETARQAVPAPVIDDHPGTRVGLLAYGGTHWAVVEARDQLREGGVPTSYCRVRALPISDEVVRYIELHERIYLIEQNRDAQVTTILKSTLDGELADRLIPITHYNGTPIAAENIVQPILAREKNLSQPGWSGADAEQDNPPVFDEEEEHSPE
jgi:2-oxoglutarate/2-oxoacid ferredoxin oxidoreductase subunit alpha